MIQELLFDIYKYSFSTHTTEIVDKDMTSKFAYIIRNYYEMEKDSKYLYTIRPSSQRETINKQI